MTCTKNNIFSRQIPKFYLTLHILCTDNDGCAYSMCKPPVYLNKRMKKINMFIIYLYSVLIYFTNPDYYQSWLVARFVWPQNSFHFASVNFINTDSTAVLLDHIHIWLLLCFNQYILVPQQTVYTVLGLITHTNFSLIVAHRDFARFWYIMHRYEKKKFSHHNFTLRKRF